MGYTMKQNRIAELSMHMPRMSPVIQLHCSVKNAVSLFFFFFLPHLLTYFLSVVETDKSTHQDTYQPTCSSCYADASMRQSPATVHHVFTAL